MTPPHAVPAATGGGSGLATLLVLAAIGVFIYLAYRTTRRVKARGRFTALAHYLALTIVADVALARSLIMERHHARKFRKELGDL